jgi:outer membrane lipoprotein SlyB
MALIWRISLPAPVIPVLVLTALSGCGPSYSPDTYAANAVQQANKVEQGVVVGVRNVAVSAAGTVGTITGAAAGGIAGSQVGAGPVSAFTSLGGALVGGIAGSAVEHGTDDTTAFEYIVRKANGDLVSVTQKDKTPMTLGQKVLVIAGNQARVVPDYTVPGAAPAKPTETAKAAGSEPKPGEAKPADATPPTTTPAEATPLGSQPAGTPSAAAAAGGTQPVAIQSSTTPPAAQPAGSPPIASQPIGAQPPTPGVVQPLAATPAAKEPATTQPSGTPPVTAALGAQPAPPAKPSGSTTQ